MHIKGSFLHAALPPKDLYVLRLPSVVGSCNFKGQLVRLLNSLYGFSKALKLWYAVHNKTLRHFFVRQSANSDSIFIGAGRNPIYIVAYVDDLLVVGSPPAFKVAKSLLKAKLVTTELVSCTHYL